MKRLFILLAALVLTFSAGAQAIKVAAAANLRFALEEIKSAYLKANPNDQIEITFGSSGALTQQILNGAGFDVFLAADKKYPEKVKAEGMAAGEVKTYAFGKLVIWSNSLDVSKGLEMLSDPAVKRIAVAKPELAPYGDRAIECLKYYHLFDQVKDKIVYADNISQAAQFAQTGNAEVGFLAYALTMAPDMKGSVFVVDPKSYKPVEQGLVQIKKWEMNPKAAKFVKFVLGNDCKPIFEKYGYLVP